MIYLVFAARFVHFLGIVTLFGAFAIQQRAVARLLRASSVEEARPWLDILLPTRPMFASGVVMQLASGVYLGRGVETPWVIVAAVTMVLFGLLFALGPWRRLTSLARAFKDTPQDALALVAARGPWLVLALLNGAAIGLIWIMVAKPDLVGTLAVLLAMAAVGALVALAVFRPAAATT